ncbi:MAG: hypothetical protein WB439_07090 [Acidobacteriaceae bacterium]
MTAMGSSAGIGEMAGDWLPGFRASVALAWSAEGAPMTLVLRDTDDTEDSDEEEDEAFDEDEEDEEDEDPDTERLQAAEPNAVHGHGKPSREEIEEELEEMESEDEAEGPNAAEEEVEKDRKRATVDRAIDSALRMSALAEVECELAAGTRGLK